MQLVLERNASDVEATIGKLYIDDVFFCYTLEDVQRDVKIQNETAIPTGTYKVLITMSPKFKRLLPLLIDVPGFDGIRIHPGNTAKDTDGCILVGDSFTKDFVTNSVKTFNELFDKLRGEDITITIE